LARGERRGDRDTGGGDGGRGEDRPGGGGVRVDAAGGGAGGDDGGGAAAAAVVAAAPGGVPRLGHLSDEPVRVLVPRRVADQGRGGEDDGGEGLSHRQAADGGRDRGRA